MGQKDAQEEVVVVLIESADDLHSDSPHKAMLIAVIILFIFKAHDRQIGTYLMITLTISHWALTPTAIWIAGSVGFFSGGV